VIVAVSIRSLARGGTEQREAVGWIEPTDRFLFALLRGAEQNLT